jgi:hypothetical protein
MKIPRFAIIKSRAVEEGQRAEVASDEKEKESAKLEAFKHINP